MGAIAGGAVGGLAFLAILTLFAIWLLERRKGADYTATTANSAPMTQSSLTSTTFYDHTPTQSPVVYVRGFSLGFNSVVVYPYVSIPSILVLFRGRLFPPVRSTQRIRTGALWLYQECLYITAQLAMGDTLALPRYELHSYVYNLLDARSVCKPRIRRLPS